MDTQIIENDLIRIIKKHLTDFPHEITSKMRLDELEIESIAMLGIVVDIENHFKIIISDNYEAPFQTIEELAFLVQKTIEAQRGINNDSRQTPL